MSVCGSPPSRAAWIEICTITVVRETRYSRRLHGRRGLKLWLLRCSRISAWSPPSRAAWIEITYLHNGLGWNNVAAFTGGVD